MNYYRKSVGKKDAKLAIFYIKRSQMIEFQVYARNSKPRENTLFWNNHKMEVEKESEIWYAMRATYRRELDAMRLLEKEKL